MPPLPLLLLLTALLLLLLLLLFLPSGKGVMKSDGNTRFHKDGKVRATGLDGLRAPPIVCVCWVGFVCGGKGV